MLNDVANVTLTAAMDYANKMRWRVFPVHSVRADGQCSCGKVNCRDSGKHPRTEHGLKDATVDTVQINRWWDRWPEANIGVATGVDSGIIVMDIDPPPGVTVDMVLDNLPGKIPDTIQCHTGGGGLHIYFKHPGGKVRNSTKKWPHTDIRADGGYVVAPPSNHNSGGDYTWEILASPDNMPLADCPPWLIEALQEPQASKSVMGSGAGPESVPEFIMEGKRNDTLFRLAASMRGRNCSLEAIRAAVRADNEERYRPPLPLDEVDRIIESAMRYPPGNNPSSQPSDTAAMGGGESKDFIKEMGITKLLADEILKDHYFAQDTGSQLYQFINGVYRPGGENLVRQRVKSVLNEWGQPAKWSSKRAEEVVEYIRVDRPVLWERPPLDTINVLNGLLDVQARKLRPHDPNYLSPIQFPVAYDPAAVCPAWDMFISEVFPPDALPLAYEIVSWCLIPDCSIQKAVLLLGSGGNGKSVFLAGLVKFLGRSNIASFSLQTLEQTRFSTSGLVGKMANICPDLPSKELADSAIFKTITGGDELTGERKFKDSFVFRPYCKLLFSANQLPVSKDASHAFFRRWLVIPFEASFTPDIAVPREVLDARLADPRELSGLLNKALVALADLKERGAFTESDSSSRVGKAFVQLTDPVSIWLDQETEACEPGRTGGFISKEKALKQYNDFAQANGHSFCDTRGFNAAIHRLRPRLAESQRMVGGVKKWCWIGIRLKPINPDWGEGLSTFCDPQVACQ
jgi:P4 family phage/plasmid primase-like protien